MSPEPAILYVYVYTCALLLAFPWCKSESVHELSTNLTFEGKLSKDYGVFQDATSNLSRAKRGLPSRYPSWIYPLSIRYAINYKFVRALFPNPVELLLRRVGYFLAAHKYFEIDRRYAFSTDKFEERTFFKHFPIPRLRRLHHVVENACNQGAFECINEIAAVAKISGSLAKFHKYYEPGKISDFYPFSSALELFRYRTTASYYMCWYADHHSKLLAYPPIHDCFKNFAKVAESKGGKGITDDRSHFVTYLYHRSHYFSPFTCAYLWFCPDPCYGKSTWGNVNNIGFAYLDPLNPCSQLKLKYCYWERGKNRNFDYLIRNRINYTCECKGNRPGFIWSPKYSICVDQDECYDGVSECPEDKVCQNAVGFYECRCRRGFYENSTTGACNRHALFRATTSKGLEKQKSVKTEVNPFWTAVDRIFGLNSGGQVTNINETCFGFVIFIYIFFK